MAIRKCEFIVKADQITFSTKANGDKIRMDGMHINSDNGADLAWLIQAGVDLKVIIKEDVVV